MYLYTVWSGHWKASLIHCHWHLQPAAASAAASALRPFSSCLFFLIASRDFCLRNSNFDPPFVIDAVLMSEASLLCNVGITWKNGTLGDLLNKIEFLIINALGNSLAMRSVNLRSSEDKNARQFDKKKRNNDH